MYFVSSDSIAGDYPDLRDVITALDAHLAAVGDGAIRADRAADFLGAEPAAIERLLKEYVRRDTLTVEQRYVCPVCDQLLSMVRSNRELWCDLCERTQSLRSKDLRGCTLYRVRSDALRGDVLPESSPPASEEAITILFVAGDRGGGPRAQLDLPAEEKTLRQAVKNATLAARFAFLPPIYAATPGQLIELVDAGPGILHVVGHGADRRLQLLDPTSPLGVQSVTPERLADLLRHAPNTIYLAYFNTCDSEATARHLAEAGVVEAAIGWPGKINDSIAVQYAEAFYRQACSGRPLRQAMQKAAVCLSTSPTQPQLFVAGKFDPETYALIRGTE